MASAKTWDIQYTAECAHEAVILRAYCESKFPVGPSTQKWQSVTGESYTELYASYPGGFDSAEIARLAAQSHFDGYSSGKLGTLYWRIVPEIALSVPKNKYAYYLRLLISDKPRKGA